MAYMDQANKARLARICKAALKRWVNVKWTLSVRNHSTIVMTIASGDIDFAECFEPTTPGAEAALERYKRTAHVQVNHHSLERDWRGECQAFLIAAREALRVGNHDNSDYMSDFVDVGWYVEINVGRWNKPYQLTGEALLARAREVGEAMAAEIDPVLTRATVAAVETALSEDDGGIL